MAHTSSIMDEPIEEIDVPVMKPIPYKRGKSPPLTIRRNFNRFADWIIDLVPQPRRRMVSRRIERLRGEIRRIYQRYDRHQIVERERALGGVLRTHRIDGVRGYDQRSFTHYIRPRVVKFLDERKKPYKMKFLANCKFKKGEEELDRYFHTDVITITQGDDVGEIYNELIQGILEEIGEFQNMGSGWQFEQVLSFDINTNPYTPLAGSSYIEVPKELAGKHAIINVKNVKDNECFKWAVTSAAFPRKKNMQRLNGEMRENAERLNWEGIVFPTPLSQIARFERNNPYSINVYKWNGKNSERVRSSEEHANGKQCINLMLLMEGSNTHYCWIKNMSALNASKIDRHKGKKYFCKYCDNSFNTEKSQQTHVKYCSNHKAVGVRMPEKGEILAFRNHCRKMRVPFVVYADFESFIEPVTTCSPSDDDSYTQQYQKHTPCSYCYYIKCFDDELFPPILRRYTITRKGVNVGGIFVRNLEADIKRIYKKFRWKKAMLPLTPEEDYEFEEATVCHICELPLLRDSVRDHCHLTGRYRGAAHNECNLAFKQPKFYPVFFHNLSGYDTHMFIKDIADTPGDIKCIAKTEENYISFSKTIVVDSFVKWDKETSNHKEIRVRREIRFLDSFKFMASSLENLAKTLDNYPNLQRHFKGPQLDLVKRKGVYPYDYMDCFEKLCETHLPPKECWYSRLNDSNISEKDLLHANEVWETFEMKTMRDYHNLYLQTDVLLLADVFERFRSICQHHYKLDPAWYYTAPGLAWDACLRETQVELELLHDQDMLLMVEKGIRGGVSMISNRYGKANNKYMTKEKDGEEYDPSKPSTYIPYLDANNLYGWAMSRKLPTDGFQWMTRWQLDNWFYHTCIVEVDLEYPIELHDLHNDYPLAPDHLRMGQVEKLIPNLQRKENYVVHYEALKTYKKYGIKVSKIHRGIVFHDSPWMKPYILFNTKQRMKANNAFEKNFFKLMNNSVFGKTMENVRKYVDIKLVRDGKQASKLINKTNFKGRTIFTPNLVAIHMGRQKVPMYKPKYLGMAILDISKTLMYEFHYGYMKPKYGKKVKLLFTDTDSFMYLIETEDFYEDILQDIHEWFDTSNYSRDHFIYSDANKMKIGMFKDEEGGKIVSEFVGLRAKNYAYLCEEKERKKCKGIKKSVTEKDISFEDYKDCLFRNVQLRRKMNIFRSYKHVVYSEEVNKVTLCANDDKRVVREDGINTFAHGHYKSYVV